MGLLMGPAIADAAIYGWQDLQGVSHYVSDPEDVPAEYRAQLITVVRDLPSPPLLATSAESTPTRTEESTSPAPERVSDPPMVASYEWGYRAGLETAASASQTPPVSIVQNFQFAESVPAAPNYYYPFGSFGFFGPVLGRGDFRSHRPFRPFKQAMGSSFIQGPAGPPPLGAPGPPPVTLIRR
jgi:hypothetical protein